MPELADVWSRALPEIKDSVTGVGVWTALNSATPIIMDEKVAVIGLPFQTAGLAGHLRMPNIKRVVENILTKHFGETITIRVIDGTGLEDYETVKRKDAEARRLQEQQLAKMRAEMTAKSSWDGVYEQLSRRYAAIVNKSLPQNRARFFEECVELIAETRQSQENWDELGERNFARCIERLAQYAEIPSAIVATHVLKRSGEL
jgi:hypothetical protein